MAAGKTAGRTAVPLAATNRVAGPRALLAAGHSLQVLRRIPQKEAVHLGNDAPDSSHRR